MRILGSSAIGAMIGLLAGCNSGVPGSGVAKTEQRTLATFSAVELQGQGRIEIELNPTPSFEITADDNLLPLIETRVDHDRLIIGNRKNIAPKTHIKIRISTEALSKLELNGAADAVLTGMQCDNLKLTLNGAGSITAGGVVGDLNAAINGSGDLHLDQLRARTATAVIAGTGTIDMGQVDELNATVAGVGDIRYRGEPRLTRKTIAGVGSISKK